MDGNRLLLKSGTYGGDGAEYQTENYSNLKITSHGVSPYGADYGPAYFKVAYPDGSVALYGNSTSSRSKLEFAIANLKDSSGTAINYTYITKGNVLLVSSIKYVSTLTDLVTPRPGNLEEPLQPKLVEKQVTNAKGIDIGSLFSIYQNEIKFNYSVLDDSKQTFYVGGVKFEKQDYLTSIEVKSEGKIYRKYDLSFKKDPLNNQFLKMVKEFNGIDTKELSPVSFGYNGDAHREFRGPIVRDEIPTNLEGDVTANKYGAINGDFDGDGVLDYLIYSRNEKKYWLYYSSAQTEGTYIYHDASQGIYGGFDAIFPIQLKNANNEVLPYEGWVEISGSKFTMKSFSEGRIIDYTSSDFNFPKIDININTRNCKENKQYNISKNFFSGDFLGTGLTDILVIEKDTKIPMPYCYNQIGFDEDKPDFGLMDGNYLGGTMYLADLNTKTLRNLGHLSGYTNGTKIVTGNFLGSTKADVLLINNGSMSLSTYNGVYFTSIFTHSDVNIRLDSQMHLGDFNGDGKMDIMFANKTGVNYIFYSTGHGFDMVRVNQEWVFQDYVNENLLYRQQHILPVMDYTNYIAVDFNNDGKTDIIEFTYAVLSKNFESPFGTVGKAGQLKSIHFFRNDGNNNFTSINSVSISGNWDTFQFIETQDMGVQFMPIPIFLSPFSKVAYTTNSFKMGLFINKKMYTFAYEYNDVSNKLLNSINQDDDIFTIKYGQYGVKSSDLRDKTDFDYYMKYSNSKVKYPLIELNTLPNTFLVSEIKSSSNGRIALKKTFSYASPVMDLQGLGFVGFKGTVSTNWYNKLEDMYKNIKEFDVSNRGLLKKESVAAGNQWDSFIPTITSSPVVPNVLLKAFESIVDYEYQMELLINKVFKPKLIKITEKNYGGLSTLLGHGSFAKETTNTYNQYNDVVQQQVLYKQMHGLSMVGQPSFTLNKTETVENTYGYGASNPNYFMSRLLKSKQTQTIPGESSFTIEDSYTYDDQGRIKEMIKKGNNTPETLIEKNTYDQYGNVSEKSIKAGNLPERTLLYKYGFSGRFLIEKTDIEGLKTLYKYNSSRGLVTEETNTLGHTTKYSYDNWGQSTSITDYLGKISTVGYVRTTAGFEVTKTTEEGGWNQEKYDRQGNKLQTSIKNIAGEIINKSFEYDGYNRLIKESENYLGNTPSLWNVIEYDRKGRISKVISTKGKEVITSYSLTTTTVNDGVSIKETSVNSAGHVTARKDAGGEIKYVYFSNGNLKSANYDGVIVSQEQDGWGRKTKLTDPSAGTYTYAYNAFGELIKEVSPKGTTLFTLDNFGKLTKKKVIGDQTNTEITFSYKEDTKQLASSVATVNGGNYTYNYVYDTYHRLSKTTETTPFASFTKQLTFDNFGRPLEETLVATSHGKSSEKKIKNQYKNGYHWQVVDALTNKVLIAIENTNEYDQLTTLKLGNGLEINNTYDIYGYLKSNTVKKGETRLFTLTNQFDVQRGNLLSRTNGLFNRTETFGYDNLDRLISFTNKAGIQETQVYDNRGRITSNTIGDYSYTSASSYQLESIDLKPIAQSYYQVRPEQKILYNTFKNPVWIKEEGKENIYFDYNSNNRRSIMYYGNLATSKEQSPLRRYYSADGNIEVNYNKTTNKVDFIFYLDGDAYSATVIAKGESAQEYYYLHRDYLGSILAVTNSTGNIVEKRHFDAWGNLVFVKDGQNKDLSKLTLFDRGYTGHEHLQGVALIHMNGRLYDPIVRRFLAPDNFIQDSNNTQNFNRYGYVLNNPPIYVDQDGEFWVVAIGAIVGAYMGASIHQGSYNPSEWGSDWWKGAVVGGVLGAYGGQALAGVIGVGGISAHTVAAKTLMYVGKGMVQSYLTSIASFEDGMKLKLVPTTETMNKMLVAGALKGAGGLIDMGIEHALYNYDFVTVWDTALIKTPVKDIVSNVIKGEPAFKRVSFLKFGNGLIDIGLGKKVIDLDTDRLIKYGITNGQGWATFGIASIFESRDIPKFTMFNLSFDYKRNEKFLQKRALNWGLGIFKKKEEK